jgi:hypothetical protein
LLHWAIVGVPSEHYRNRIKIPKQLGLQTFIACEARGGEMDGGGETLIGFGA